MPSIGGTGGSPSGGSGGGSGGPPGFGLSVDYGGGHFGENRGGSSFSRNFINTALTLTNPFLTTILALGTRGDQFGDIAQGDPGGGYGLGGGGPAAFRASTLTQKALTQPIAPAAPVKPPVIPLPTPQKKRVGRQETILTSGLAEVPTLKPTLLGQ
jgi:hypothetical protein